MTTSPRIEESPRHTVAYNSRLIERKWIRRWDEEGCFRSNADDPRPRYFNFDGGPFPNGSLHVGHLRTFTQGDVIARAMRMRGHNVLYAFEFDAFGLPNEIAAAELGISPRNLTEANVLTMRTQMQRLGYSYDWRYVHVTSDPRYFRWTQWLFLRLHEKGLIYRGEALLDFCPSCKTTVAQMQVEDGHCSRCGSSVDRRILPQWFVRLSSYNELLAATLPGLDGWSPQVKRMLSGFIGRTEGFQVDCEVVSPAALRGRTLTVFASDQCDLNKPQYILVAKESLAARSLGPQQMAMTVRFPVTQEILPVQIADKGDPWFAGGVTLVAASSKSPVVTPREAQDQIRPATFYRAHDWLVSRQKSWGTPIPVILCPQCGGVPAPDEDLPILPAEDGQRTPTGKASGEKNVSCPRCGETAQRESDTVDCYFDVLWCFIACTSPLSDEFCFRHDDLVKWLPVDCFHNGIDSVFYAHLYRFLGRVLYDMGLLDDPEPIRRYHGHAMVLNDGKKMSKHLGNAVDLAELLDIHGSDILRFQILDAGRSMQTVSWSRDGTARAQKFIDEVWALLTPRAEEIAASLQASDRDRTPVTGKLSRMALRSAKRITAFLDSYRMSGCTEELRLLLRHLQAITTRTDRREIADFAQAARAFVLLLSPFCPFISEELWEQFGQQGLAATASWPIAVDDSSEISTLQPNDRGPRARSSMEKSRG